MNAELSSTVLLAGIRTPFQRAGTGFRDLMSYQLAAAAIAGVLRRAEVEPTVVDRVILGATVHNPRTTNVAREAALAAGLPATVPAMTVTAAGASATAAISTGADLIATGQADVVIAGASDCVSDPPIGYSRKMRSKLLAGRRLKTLGQKLRFLASLRPWDFLPDMPDVREFSTGLTMGEYTEQLARQLAIGREAQDAYALESHRRAAAATDAGWLAEEITGVDTRGTRITEDNGIRADTSPERLAHLKPSFDPAGGTLTAGNSSFLTDGAAVVLLASRRWAEEHGTSIIAELRGQVMTAHDPGSELLLGPAFAIPRLLAACQVPFEDVDVFEIHEAFAAQILAVIRLLAAGEVLGRPLAAAEHVGEIAAEKLNAWGGSLAIGNPFAPNGARLVTTAGHRLRRDGGRYAVVATCAGGGLGQAMLWQRDA
ncbi:MAG: thiolase family protein [Acidobacteriota bacterium]